MGCWNKTCGLSNLHIRAGEQVYVFPLVQNTEQTDRCYSTAFWSPVMIPFLSTYNDYGGGENSHENIEYTLRGLRKQLVEMEQGANEYHDIPVKKDKMDEALFFEAVHEGRLFIEGYRKEPTRVDFVMIKASVIDYICENYKIEKYVGDGKGTHGYGNNYIYYTWDDVVADSNEVIDRLKQRYDEVPDGEDPLLKQVRRLYAARAIGDLFGYNHPNHAAAYLRWLDDYRVNYIVRPLEALADAILEGPQDEAKALMVDILRASFMHSFMECSRKNWAPGGHEGSQSQEHAPYRVLCGAITSILDAEVAECEE